MCKEFSNPHTSNNNAGDSYPELLSIIQGICDLWGRNNYIFQIIAESDGYVDLFEHKVPINHHKSS